MVPISSITLSSNSQQALKPLYTNQLNRMVFNFYGSVHFRVCLQQLLHLRGADSTHTRLNLNQPKMDERGRRFCSGSHSQDSCFHSLVCLANVSQSKKEGPGDEAKCSSTQTRQQGRGVVPIPYLAESDIVHTLGLKTHSIIECTGDKVVRTSQHMTDRNTLGSPQHQAHDSLVL